MPRPRIFQVDAFTSTLFKGNPAAVVPLDDWLPDTTMQAIAAENNLSETAFFVRTPGAETDYHIRWFTPKAEVALCGHATLATAHVLFTELGRAGESPLDAAGTTPIDTVSFTCRSGTLRVSRDDTRIALDFPALPLEAEDTPIELVEALGVHPDEVYAGMDLICVFDNKRTIHELSPDFRKLATIDGVRAVGVTAPGAGHDFVARLFAPAVGIDEDPVTGSLYTMLAPYWAQRLGKDTLTAHQVSPRGGELWLHVLRDNNANPSRVRIAGHAVTYLRGEIDLPS